MATSKEITSYNKALDKASRDICVVLAEIIDETLTKAESKVWHGAPVWFLDGNPIVGYSKKKAGVELLFWSGQSFDEEQLKPVGKYMAAGYVFASKNEVSKSVIERWIQKSRKIQWDYANLPKNRQLLKLTEF